MTPVIATPWTWTNQPTAPANVGIQLGPRFFTWTNNASAPPAPNKVIQLITLQTVGNY